LSADKKLTISFAQPFTAVSFKILLTSPLIFSIDVKNDFISPTAILRAVLNFSGTG
jgi:hypothetical protein